MNTNLQTLRALGQSIWLDNITRELLDNGTLQRYIDDYAVTGLTSSRVGIAYDADQLAACEEFHSIDAG